MHVHLSKIRKSALLALLCAACATAHSAVLINELMAAASERRLSWDSRSAPHLGSGVQWIEPAFDSLSWSNSLLPAGYGFSGLVINLTTTMKDKTPSLYLRKEFQATPEQAESTNQLILSAQYDDGFVAYLNGREVARVNCGPTNHFMFASQPAYNVSTTTNVVQFVLGPAVNWLSATGNVLAIQAHNAEQPSTTAQPEQIAKHLPTPEFRINAGLILSNGTNPPSNLIAVGPSGGLWRYFVGVAEPSGGVIDLGLATRPFTPPSGEEDDYEQPAAVVDWVELFNDGGADVDLSGWSLSDDPDAPAKWRFPTNTILRGGACLLVLCDDADEANAPAGPALRLHANFKLGDDGGYLMLFDALGHAVDGFPAGYPPQSWDGSFGRNPDDPASFGFLGIATPGTTNRGPFYSGRAEPPLFQTEAGAPLPGGLYLNQSPVVYLRHPVPGATIRYTLDGSEPTSTYGSIYTDPLALSQPDEKTAIVLRARAFLPDLLPSDIQTHTYVLRQHIWLTNAPSLFLTGDAGRSFYSPDGLLAIVGGQYVNVSSGSIWQANGPDSYNNVIGAGLPYERQAHIEYYFPTGYYSATQAPFRADAGIRVSASPYSRPRIRTNLAASSSPWPPGDYAQKPSFNVYFAGDYGPGELDYRLFRDYSVHEFQHLRLRAGKNDIRNPFITDEFVRRLWLDMGHVGARGSFCSLYVNGAYKGVYNPCERIREPFFQSHYDSQHGWDVNYIWSWVDGDNSVYQTLLTALDRNLTNLTNWEAVTTRIDVENAADYYLLNIYCAMWDWPQNNFVIARERSTGPNSRFRFAVWDAEGAFNAINYGIKTVSYNTITNDLIVPSSHANYWIDLSRIFRRLATSPEFRLLFADRVNRRMFNGAILDDRDPDGTGPQQSHFRNRLDQLVTEAGDLVRYNANQVLNVSAFTSWVTPTTGRRSFLLGTLPGRTMFRDSGLWPVTEPPVFNQHGGTVPPGFLVQMSSSIATTGQTASIWYTLDGTDPRLTGGSRNPAAQFYAAPLPLADVVTIKARAQNNTTSEWSPLTEATFSTGTVPASTNNLVIAEVMYHPPGLSTAEIAARFDNADDFEFVRLQNIGDRPLDLAGVRFAGGITNNFTSGAVRYLSPGASVLIVKKLAAFQFRYGHSCDSLIAGEYDGNLANSGERVLLVAVDGSVLRDFSYLDIWPWPAAADGDGPSLLLNDPRSNPDHAQPTNWVASAVPGGLPTGTPPSLSFAAWRSLFWANTTATNNVVSGPDADPDNDGLSNLIEYALGLNPRQTSASPLLTPAIEQLVGEPALTISLRMAPGAQQAAFVWQSSDDLATWRDDTALFQLINSEPLPDGTALRKFWYTLPVPAQGSRFVRLGVHLQ